MCNVTYVTLYNSVITLKVLVAIAWIIGLGAVGALICVILGVIKVKGSKYETKRKWPLNQTVTFAEA